MLLRHAKSSWADNGLDDRARPLSKRGLSAAPAMGAFMRREGLIPDLVLCSPARRAHETWKLACKELKAAPATLVEEAIYDFGNGGRLLDAVRSRANGARHVLIVGHNPSIERLALRLAGGDSKLAKVIARKYPTGALAVIDFDARDWREAGDGKGVLASFTRPADLVKE
jgi:phosphohistidine phosphatase